MSTETKLTIANGRGTFEWSLPKYGGSPAALARVCFEKAGAPYVDPVPTSGAARDSPTCPKCGGESHCTWLRAGSTRVGKPNLWGLGKAVGLQGKQFTVKDECLLRQCACGYEWLAPIVENGGGR